MHAPDQIHLEQHSHSHTYNSELARSQAFKGFWTGLANSQLNNWSVLSIKEILPWTYMCTIHTFANALLYLSTPPIKFKFILFCFVPNLWLIETTTELLSYWVIPITTNYLWVIHSIVFYIVLFKQLPNLYNCSRNLIILNNFPLF